jgi:hypothetical protein
VRLNKRQKRMQRIVTHFQEYVRTYDSQMGYLDYEDKTLLDDMLYGLGLAIDEKYRYGSGYDKFKTVLRNHLDK